MSSRDTYVASIKSAFVTLGVKTVMGFLTVEIPFLASPIIQPIVQWFVEMIINRIVDAGEMQAFFFYIDTRVDKQGKEFEAAAYANFEAQKNGTPEQKQAAKEDLMRKFKSFAVLKS